MLPPDTELVARVVLRDDRHAFAELVRRHQSPVRSLLRRLAGGDQAWADDLAQETFIKVYAGIAGWRGVGKLSSWIFRVAFNVFAGEHKKRVRRATDAVAEPPEPRLDTLSFEPSFMSRGLERALLAVPTSERAALLLVSVHGLSYDEAAEVLASPVGTVKTHVHRAKARLREVLGHATGT